MWRPFGRSKAKNSYAPFLLIRARVRNLLRTGNLLSVNFLQYRAGSSEVRQWRSKSKPPERKFEL
jgi:hypothetical protein